MEIMIVGGNFRGKGAEAMLLTVIRELADRIPGVRFIVLTEDNEPIPQDRMTPIKDVPVSIMQAPPMSLDDLAFWGINRLLLVGRLSRLRQYYRFASQSVAVIDISGYSFMPRGGFPGRTSSRYAARLLLSRQAGAKHIILPQVMGPIRGRLDRSLARRALLSASSITVRDQVTWSILEDLGVTKTKPVAVCPDIAFRFSAAPQRRAQEILGGIGVGDSPLVLVTPNMRVYERSPLHEGENLYLETMVQLVQNLVGRLHVAVLLIPYELSPRGKDDAWLADEILARLENCEQVFALYEPLGAADIKAITGCAQLLVGSRYHSLIAALSMRVPCVAISWSHKYEMLMGSVELGEYVCHVSDLDFKVLWNKVLNLWNKRDEVVPDLERAVSRFESDLNRLFDQVANLVQGGSVEHQVAGDSGDLDE